MTDLAAIFEASVLSPVEASMPSSGRKVAIQRYLRTEVRGPDSIARTAHCWAPNKPTIIVGGVRTWPEFAIVRRLEDAGWEARWIKNWAGGREFCHDLDRPVPLSALAADHFAAIHLRAVALKGAGPWDVFAWNGSDYLYIESKQHKSGDRLNPNQLAWLEAAIDLGIDPSSFAVVEYDAGRPIKMGTPTLDPEVSR